MCYTAAGLELTRVTVVDHTLKSIYETLVKPDLPVVDYNSRFSGITAGLLAGVKTRLQDVQRHLLSLFSTDTILIGHSLNSDLLALKLIHSKVVDTSIVFPHPRGLPYRRALRTLAADILRKIIQENVEGHDSFEDSAVCMELMIWKAKQDLNKQRRKPTVKVK
jgi:RNA exonuclease 1